MIDLPARLTSEGFRKGALAHIPSHFPALPIFETYKAHLRHLIDQVANRLEAHQSVDLIPVMSIWYHGSSETLLLPVLEEMLYRALKARSGSYVWVLEGDTLKAAMNGESSDA